MNKLQRLKEYLENNTKEAINLINNIINGNINELKDVERKESERLIKRRYIRSSASTFSKTWDD